MTNIWHHWPGVDEDVAAIFDPFGNAVHTALSFPVLGEDVLVTGAGPIGCMAAAVVRHAGARHVVVTDLNPYRLELARRMGATLAVDPRERDARRRPARAGDDGGVRRRPRDVRQRRRRCADMVANMAHGGRIAVLGIPTAEITLDLEPIIFNMLTIKGIYGREMYETWYQMSVMLTSGLDIDAGDHAPLLAPRLRGGVRRRPLGRVGQGRPRLDATRRRKGDRRVRNAAGRPRRSDWPRRRRGRDVQDRAGDDHSAGGARRRHRPRRAPQPVRQQLPRPREPSGDRRGRARGARPLGLRHGLRPLHLRHAGAPPRARGAALRVPRHRRHDPLQLVLRRERRPLRGAPRRGGRRHLRPAEPRLASSTASASARRGGSATRTATWTSSRRGSRRRPTPATG